MTASIVVDFIENVWNRKSVNDAGIYLHPDFTDYSLPDGLPADAEGLKKWIALTSASFEHQTIIEDRVTEGDKCVIKITMRLKHIGAWREIPATGKEVFATGYRLFWCKDGKIISHWALIDGNALESQLKGIQQSASRRKVGQAFVDWLCTSSAVFDGPCRHGIQNGL